MERNILHTQKDEAKRQGVELLSYTFNSEQLLKVRQVPGFNTPLCPISLLILFVITLFQFFHIVPQDHG